MTTTHTPTAPAAIPEIWSIRDIASFYRRSIRQASRIVSDATFPRPIRGDKHRWAASDVVAYAVSSDHGVEGVLKHNKTSAKVVRIPRSSKMRYAGARS
jgi:hypothetical protein